MPKTDAAMGGVLALQTLITTAGPGAQKRFLEFFTATIRNPNTRMASRQQCLPLRIGASR